MTEVRYYCPRCEAIATLEREGYLADKCVTPHPLDGWEYVATYEDFGDADGVEIVCGGWETQRASQRRQNAPRSEGTDETDGEGCGEVYYLSFVRFENGEEVEPRRIADVLPSRPTIARPESDPDEDDDGPRFDFEP
jgi:hypothetical protein